MALRTPDKADDKLNPGQADYSRKFDGIAKQEEAGTFDDIAKNYGQTADPSQENANISKAQALENNPTGDWKTKIGDAKDIALAASGNAPTSASKSPLVVILIIIFGGGFSFAGLFGAFSLLPIDVVSQFFNKEDAQSTSFNIRADKIINTKISKATTSGFCTPDKQLLCKYEKPSNKLLKALDKEGVKAFDKEGTLIKGTGLFPNARPDHFTYTDSNGYEYKIAAKDFSSTLANDPEFRAAFHNAYTPRFVSYADSVFQAIKKRFGFTTSDKNAKATSKEDVTKTLDETSKGPETGATKAAAEAGDEVGEELAKGLITTEGINESKSIAESGKGNAVGLIAGVACAVGDIPGLIIKTVRAYQLIQLIRYSVTIVTSIEAWKANQATPEEITGVGDLLTTVVAGKSAMDSFGIKNILFGDTQTTDTSYKTFVPGGSVVSALGGINQFTGSTAKTDFCAVATNPATGLAIDGATSETVIGPLLNFAVGLVAGVALEQAAPYIINAAVGVLPIQPILQFFLGDLTKGLAGQDVGNALTSGLVHMMGQTANKGGNMALTIKQKLAYNQATDQVNLAYAQEDRATHSPLDATNPNTFLGSLVGNLLPYYSDMGSLTGFVSSLGSIVTGSLGSIFRQASASAVADDGSEYTLCNDPTVTGAGTGADALAAGPFCNLEYGVPPQYLDKDPEEVANDLIASGDIDPSTGDVIEKDNPPISFSDPNTEAKGSYSGWLALCGDGTTANANNCSLTDANINNNPAIVDYALYTIDHRIQTTMDGEDPVLDPTTNSSDSSSSSATDSSSSTSTDNSTSTPTPTTDSSSSTSTPSTDTTGSGSTTPATDTTGIDDTTQTTPPPTSGYVPVANSRGNYAMNISNLFTAAILPKKLQGITI